MPVYSAIGAPYGVVVAMCTVALVMGGIAYARSAWQIPRGRLRNVAGMRVFASFAGEMSLAASELISSARDWVHCSVIGCFQSRQVAGMAGNRTFLARASTMAFSASSTSMPRIPLDMTSATTITGHVRVYPGANSIGM